MTLSSNPSYQALAATAAAALGNPSQSIVKAILAQWQCELGNVSYPPTRNNPGNVARGWADAIGIPYTVQMPNPQPGNPIVTFASASDGARAYAGGIRSFKRYAAARLAITRGDGRAFLLAITAAGYGTNVACALRVYGGTGTVSTTPNATPAVSYSPQATPPPWINDNAHVLSHADLEALRDWVLTTHANAANFHALELEVNAILLPNFGSPNKNYEGHTVGELRADAPGLFTTGPALDQYGAGAGFLDQIGGVLAGVAVNGAVLVLILALAYSGLKDLLEGPRT